MKHRSSFRWLRRRTNRRERALTRLMIKQGKFDQARWRLKIEPWNIE